ncbi:MAG: aldose 1-epimerase family protein [Fuerstiella sp.]|nr:aldose 1-epimerase family protein [Fuerstiella sp.]
MSQLKMVLTAVPVLLAAALLTTESPGQDSFRHILTSSEQPHNDQVWKVDAVKVTPNCRHPWRVQKSVLKGGRQEGVDQIIVDSGAMEIVLCPTRGMGIIQVTAGDVVLKWDSPVKEIVNPQFVNLNSRGGLGWLEGFNEFMCRCGLESNGHPGTDRFINNVGDEAEMELTLHGKIANIPARHVEVIVDRKPPYAIHIRGQVDEKLLFGPKLELHTELIVIPGETSFQLVDEIKNVGAQEQEFEILYHANFGNPLLEEGAQVVASVKSVKPFNDHAASGLDTWNVYAKPTTGFVEQVYLLELNGDDNNHTTALLHNKAANKAATISWSLDELPYLTLWKNTGALADGYVTGIEPGTNYPNNRSVERQAGRVPKLGPGESHKMTLKFGVHSGAKAVKSAIDFVRDIGLAGEPVDSPRIKAIRR